jgi:hypothetical protein
VLKVSCERLVLNESESENLGRYKIAKLFKFINVANFWDIVPRSPYVNRRFGGKYRFHLQGRKSAEQKARVHQVSNHLLQAGFLLGGFLAMKMEVIFSSEESVHIQTTRGYRQQ